MCEVTGGGQKVYGVAIRYDRAIDPASVECDTYAACVIPAGRGYMPGLPTSLNNNATTPRAIAAIYTNAGPALRADRTSTPGPHVIAEFRHEADPSLPTADSDRVSLVQNRAVRTTLGTSYGAIATTWNNAGRRGNSTFARGVDDWEQSHWWWDDTWSAGLEYSIYLPETFLKPAGEKRPIRSSSPSPTRVRATRAPVPRR